MNILKISLILLLVFFFAALAQNTHAQPKRFKDSDYKTLGYRSCGTSQANCHVDDFNWWKDDVHAESLGKLKVSKSRAMQIAQAYGMSPADYLKGNSKCGECHGEVVTKRSNKNMTTGVSCELCHGPSGPKDKGYYEVHQEGQKGSNPANDLNRSGYQKAIRVGLEQLRKTNVRARACVDCHYINEKKLLEAGHPTGEAFNYVRGIKNNISQHWDYKIRPADIDKTPYDKEKIRRGPIPEYAEIQPPGGTATGGGSGPIIIYRGTPAPPWLDTDNTISLPPFTPQIDDSSSVEEILRKVKQRIDLIHKKIGGTK